MQPACHRWINFMTPLWKAGRMRHSATMLTNPRYPHNPHRSFLRPIAAFSRLIPVLAVLPLITGCRDGIREHRWIADYPRLSPHYCLHYLF